MSRVRVVTDTAADVDKRVAAAWARIEASLSGVLPASLRQLQPPADAEAIDAVEAALAVPLPQDFRVSLRIHNGTKWIFGTDGQRQPSPIPVNYLFDTDGIVEATRMWRDNYHPEPNWDDPRVWAYQVDDGNHLFLNGPVRPIVGSPGAVLVGDMNGDVTWFLDFDPAPGERPDRWFGLMSNAPRGTYWPRPGHSSLSATPRIWSYSRRSRPFNPEDRSRLRAGVRMGSQPAVGLSRGASGMVAGRSSS